MSQQHICLEGELYADGVWGWGLSPQKRRKEQGCEEGAGGAGWRGAGRE